MAMGPLIQPNRMQIPGLKPKDLAGVPWRVAFALQATGWYLRSDIIWGKPNPMPESVTDRPTKAHEYIFLFGKSQKYFFDQEAVREPDAGQDHPRNLERTSTPVAPGQSPHMGIRTAAGRNCHGRNIRSVWTIPTQPYAGPHFATFPRELAKRCILAGTSEKGCCPRCRAPWKRVVDRKAMLINRSSRGHGLGRTRSRGKMVEPARTITVGWRPSCNCDAGDPIPCIVLDPFVGSGTTVMVARDLGRVGVGLDLTYQALAAERVGGSLFKAVVNSAWDRAEAV
jgi:hypothetical protein